MRDAVLRLPPSARKVVLLAREGVERGLPLQAALSLALDRVPLSPEARRQATDLCYWSLRAETRCLWLLKRLFPRLSSFSEPVRRLLVAAVASLLFQKGAPAYAVLNESVEDARRLGGKGVAGAVNGGLRSFLRLGEGPFDPQFYRLRSDRDGLSALFRLYSVEEGLGRLLVDQLGEEAALAVLKKGLSRPLASVRLNAARSGWPALKARLLSAGARELPGPAGERGLLFPESPASFSLSALAGEGALSLQSAGSQLALASLSLDREVPLWDACAGFGGKSLALLEGGVDVSLASDVSARRLESLPRECARLGLPLPHLVLADAARPPLSSWPGDILLDVPCSGLGVLARRPDIKLRARDLAAYVPLQRSLLASALSLLRPGRRVAYLTCTPLPRENGLLVRALCAEHGATLESEWATEASSPFEDMYAALLGR